MIKNRVSNIREYFVNALKNEEFVMDKTGVKTIELVGASFIADEETIFGEVNHEYIERELAWYESKSLNVYDIPGGPPQIWKQVADRAGYINSNYGWCIWDEMNGSQYNHVCNELLANPNSRRAVMIYTRPEMWYQYNFDGRSDFMCTNTVQYLVREGALDVVVQMRSNDVYAGYRNDYSWQEHVQIQLSHDLGVIPGNIYWNVGSLHVYEKQFYLIDHFSKTGEIGISKKDYKNIYAKYLF